MNNSYPEQRVSVAKKLKPEWYKYNVDYWINLAVATNNKADTRDNLNAANGIIDNSTYDYVLKPLGNSLGEDNTLPGQIREIDLITPIKEKNIGEYIELPYSFIVKLNDPDISALRNKEVTAQVSKLVEDYINNILVQMQQEGNGEQPDPTKLKQDIKQLTETWFDNRVEKVSNLLEYVNDLNDFENKRIQAFYYWWATEEVYIHSYITNSNIAYDMLSPLEGYPVLSGEAFTEDGDAFVIVKPKSITQVLSEYDEDLKPKDREYLLAIQNGLTIGDGVYDMSVNVYNTIYGKAMEATESIDINGSISFSNSLLQEYIVYYKTEVRKKTITRINPVGQLVESIEEEDYELDPDLGDIAEKYTWIDEVWKQVRLHDKNTGIYFEPEPLAMQIYDIKGNVKLPVSGKKGLLQGMNINPIPKRVLPSIALYRIINLHLERQLAKYKSTVEIIPKGLLASMDGDPKSNWFYKIADGTIIYDEQKFSANEVNQGYIVKGNPALGNYIRDLIDLRESIKSEAWDLANMNDSRYGQAAASSTVRNNEQNLYRAKLGSLLMVTMFNNILAKHHNMVAELGKIAYNDGISGTIFDKKDRRVRYFNIEGGELSNMDLGIFVVNSVLEKQKLEEYKKLGFNASQNGDTELASETIDADNSSELRKYIREFSKRKQQFEEQMAAREQQSNERIAKSNQEAEAIKQESKLKEIELEQGLITERELKLAQLDNNQK